MRVEKDVNILFRNQPCMLSSGIPPPGLPSRIGVGALGPPPVRLTSTAVEGRLSSTAVKGRLSSTAKE